MKHSPAKRADGAGRVRRFLSSRSFRILLITMLSSLLLLALFMAAITPTRYSLSVGMVPTQTIVATKDVVDEITTERNRRAAADAITPTYKYQEGVTEMVVENLELIKQELSAVLQYAKTLEKSDQNTPFSAEELKYASEMLDLVPLRDFQLRSLMQMSQEEFDSLFSALHDTIQNTMQTNITQGQEATAISGIMQIIGYKTDINILQNIASPVLRAVIIPNMVIDKAATDAAKKNAMDQIDPVVYKQGQNIVVRGEGRVRENQIRMLSELGLLSSNKTDYNTYLGALIVVLVSLVIFNLMLLGTCPQIFRYTTRLMIVYLVMMLAMLLAIAAKGLHLVYLAPMLLAPMLLSVTVGHIPALITNCCLSVLLSFILSIGGQNSTGDLVYILVSSLIAGTVAGLLLRDNVQRVGALAVGLIACTVSFSVIIGIGIMVSSDISLILQNAGWSVAGGVLSTLLCLGLQPLFESLFNLPTQSRLLDMCNPTQPLLHRLLTEAPGTYHHSLIIGNLAEASAEAVGAGALLARVGGYYHDIGKLKRPLYFKENQFGQSNIHDGGDPKVSATIITAHVRDGLMMAKQYRLPPEIQDIIADHHGNSLVRYFYSQALEASPDGKVNEEDFRYQSSPPRTKEGAIVMLCDTIEAAVRTLSNPTKDEIREFIVKLIREKTESGQLDNAPLSMSDLSKIAAACANILYGVFHERIEYPELKPKKHPWPEHRSLPFVITSARNAAQQTRKPAAPEKQGKEPPAKAEQAPKEAPETPKEKDAPKGESLEGNDSV